jgi:hypothetical protein
MLSNRFSDLPLPKDRTFGLFFTGVFAVAAAWFGWLGNEVWLGIFAGLSALCLALTLINARALRPFNKAWMMLGLLLGMIISPIVLGVLFFGLFTPLALVMRLFGRDELRLKHGSSVSHWRLRNRDEGAPSSFKTQF